MTLIVQCLVLFFQSDTETNPTGHLYTTIHWGELSCSLFHLCQVVTCELLTIWPVPVLSLHNFFTHTRFMHPVHSTYSTHMLKFLFNAYNEYTITLCQCNLLYNQEIFLEFNPNFYFLKVFLWSGPIDYSCLYRIESFELMSKFEFCFQINVTKPIKPLPLTINIGIFIGIFI